MTLKLIFGFNMTYENLLKKAGVEILEHRRKEAFLNFSKSISANERYKHWFPLNECEVNLRRGKIYREENAKTDRLYNSPLFSMRRALNEIYEENQNRKTNDEDAS